MIATLLILLGGAIVAAIHFWKKWATTSRELADMTEERDVQACKVWGLNQDLRGLVGARDDGYTRAEIAEADADRLAPFVKNFIADITAVSAQLGTLDNKPLDLTDEREAIRLHEEAVKLRTK